MADLERRIMITEHTIGKSRQLHLHLVNLQDTVADLTLHCRGGSGHELEDEMAAQDDAQRDAAEAISEGDERPSGQSFTQRAIGDATFDAGSKGSLSDEYAEKEGESRFIVY